MMNNILKKRIIIFLIIISSFLFLNIRVNAANLTFNGMYPIRASYSGKKFKTGATTEKLEEIGLYFQKANTEYTQLFCLEPGVSLNAYTLDTIKFTKLEDYTGINSNYQVSSEKKLLLQKIISVTPQLSSDDITGVANAVGAYNIEHKNYVTISNSTMLNKLEGAFATQAIIWEIISGQRTSFSSYKPDNASTGTTSSGVYNSFYEMVKTDTGLSNLKSKYEGLIDLVKSTYLNSNLGSGSCVFKSASPYNNCKLNDQGSGAYSITITDPNFRYFKVESADSNLNASISGDKLTIVSYGSISPSSAKSVILSVKPINKSTSNGEDVNSNPIQIFENERNQDLSNIRSVWQTYKLNVYTDDTVIDEGEYHLRVKKLGGKTFATTPLAGATFKIYKCPEGSLIGQISCGEFSSRTPISSDPYDMVSLSDGYAYYENLPSAGKYAVVEVTPPEGYKKSDVTNYINVTEKSTSSSYDGDFFGMDYTFENYEETETPEQVVRIKKVDKNTKAPLAGAVFKVGTQEVVTDSSGYAQVTLTPGLYIFEEVTPPEGYIISENSGYSCTVCYNPGSLSCLSYCPEEIVFENEIIPEEPVAYQLKFSKLGKYSEDSESYFALEGVEFELYKSDKRTIVNECNIITNEESTGQCTSVPEPGTYYLKEKKAPEGYQENEDFYEVNVTADNIAGSASWAVPLGDKTGEPGIIYNIMIPAPETVYYMAGISKYDALSNEKIVGATFNLLDDSYKVVETCKNLVTNSNGVATCSSLTKPGIYYFQEISAASGYVVDKSYVPIKVEQSDTVTTGGVKVTFSNQPTTGKLIKYTVDKNGNKTKLDDGCGTDNYTGPIFEIKDENGRLLHFTKRVDGEYVLSNLSSDTTEIKTCNGEFKVRKLNKGRYTVSEKQSPQGRYYQAEDQIITITDNGPDSVITFDNVSVPDDDPLVSVINFKKKHEDGIAIENGVFVLQKKENGKYVDVKLEKRGETYVYSTDSSVTNYQMENGTGEYLITNVPQGEYRIVERQAPEGYQLISDVDSKAIVTVDDTGKQYYIEMVDKKANVNGSSSSAELIITISTGRKVLNYVLIIGGLALVLGTLILIRKKMKK